ncbi:head GIN domain-containing protein [Dokdonia pacifica]|uniref:Putative auto-transporter adhesin, head GIN domain n=1 Tax=Dokdonia pacifica TaxID=1627892 RepID=A0A238WFL7_9FLAO|nr:head GIN domain-containing protein [Dokdonia pacifica]SNR45044.1 Putative auto-transporter adhesin, head GIN domain [Dokdonia pacifica]
MKKIIMTVIAVCISAITFGQITKNVGDFTEVKVYDRIVVNLVKSDENKVVISGADASQVEVVNKDGKLKIRMEFDLIFDGNNTFVNVYYNNLKIIDGNEGAEITSNELIEQDNIEIKMQEGARINVGLKVQNVTMRAVTGGMIEATGMAVTQDVTVNTGGVYEGRDLETEEAKVFVQAGGEVEVYASKKADITIRAGGDVDVYGKPAEVKRRRTFGGRIRIL